MAGERPRSVKPTKTDAPALIRLTYVVEKRTESNTSWIASPILAESHAGLAPAVILCAEFDVLRSEAEAYNEKLLKAETKSSIKVFKGVAHPWGHWDGELEKAKEYVADTFHALQDAHGLKH